MRRKDLGRKDEGRGRGGYTVGEDRVHCEGTWIVAQILGLFGVTWGRTSWQPPRQTRAVGAFHLAAKNVQYQLSSAWLGAAVMLLQFFVLFQ